MYSAHPVPHFDGFHLLRADLACPPGEFPDLPCMFDDPDTRGRDAKEFTGMAIESGLALRR